MMCCDCEWGVCGFADMDVWQSSDLPDPIKPKAAGVVCPNNSLVTFLASTPILAMSLVNNRTFEHSMGHQISREDA